MRELIKTLGASATLLISTHILPEVEAVCDRVLILRRTEPSDFRREGR
jgi:ABC-2 type transport system ATP-binding protein